MLQLAQEVFMAAKVFLFAAGALPAAVAAAAARAAARKRRRVVNFCWVSFFLVVAALVSVNQAEAACTAAVMHCHCWLRFHGLTRLWKGCVLVRHSVRSEPLYLIECVECMCVFFLFFVLYYLFVLLCFLDSFIKLHFKCGLMLGECGDIIKFDFICLSRFAG